MLGIVTASIRVSALTDHLHTPSSRFRIRQLIPLLLQNGIHVTDSCRKYSSELAGSRYPDQRIRSDLRKMSYAIGLEASNMINTFYRALKTRAYDAAWISRELITGYPSYESLLNRRIFYDIDDAVFLGNPSLKYGIMSLIRRATCIFAGNQYLFDFCSQYSSNVLYIPTAVDTDRFTPLSIKPLRDKFLIGWSGTSTSFQYLLKIQAPLLGFLQAHPSASLKICADRYPSELTALLPYINFEKWSPDLEVSQIQSLDVGLMPLENTEWIKGKCAYKMLLYASCGIPTIASSYGVNNEVLGLGRLGIGCETTDMWHDALNFMYDNKCRLSDLFPDCRDVVERHYSLPLVSNRISSAMKHSLGN